MTRRDPPRGLPHTLRPPVAQSLREPSPEKGSVRRSRPGGAAARRHSAPLGPRRRGGRPARPRHRRKDHDDGRPLAGSGRDPAGCGTSRSLERRRVRIFGLARTSIPGQRAAASSLSIFEGSCPRDLPTRLQPAIDCHHGRSGAPAPRASLSGHQDLVPATPQAMHRAFKIRDASRLDARMSRCRCRPNCGRKSCLNPPAHGDVASVMGARRRFVASVGQMYPLFCKACSTPVPSEIALGTAHKTVPQ